MLRLAIVGATGLVGSEIFKVLEKHNLALDQLIPVASEKSVGKLINFNQTQIEVVSVDKAIELRPNVAIFSAGGNTSKTIAKRFTDIGCYVIDNSSAWRMDKDIPLIVPEVNASSIKKENLLIANPNCSTIQLVVALKPLFDAYGIRRLILSTYQSVSGSGVKGIRQLEAEEKGEKSTEAYPHPIHRNCLPHAGDFDKDGYTSEEIKLRNETHKILGDNSIGISSTVVRVPVCGGHSIAANIELEKPFNLTDIEELFSQAKGIILQNNHGENEYPMPIFAHGKDEVFVGRLRRDFSNKNTLNVWIVADNLRKGAATNAVQILEVLLEKKFV